MIKKEHTKQLYKSYIIIVTINLIIFTIIINNNNNSNYKFNEKNNDFIIQNPHFNNRK